MNHSTTAANGKHATNGTSARGGDEKSDGTTSEEIANLRELMTGARRELARAIVALADSGPASYDPGSRDYRRCIAKLESSLAEARALLDCQRYGLARLEAAITAARAKA